MNLRHRSVVLVQLVGILCVLTAPVWVYELFYGDPDQPPSTEFFTIPIVVLATFVLLGYLTRRDAFLRQVAFVGLLCKLVATAANFYMAYWYYEGAADLFSYEHRARFVVDVFTRTGRLEFLQPVWSSAAPPNLLALLFIVFGPSRLLGCVFFALLSFWGEYLLYRAFCVAYPNGDRRIAAIFLFLLPSIVFWTASIGKDALILFFIGFAIYGFALMDRNTSPGNALLTLLGLGGVLLVRPHVAGMLAIAFIGPFALRTGLRRGRDVAFRFVSVPLLLVATFYLARGAQEFVGLDDISRADSVLNRVGSANNIGTSAFGGAASITARVLAAPVLFFRPFPWEIHNLPAALASVEGLLLLFFTWRYRQQILSALRQNRGSFTMFVTFFVVEFSIIFSAAITNFGLLARERTMAIPLFVMLLCIVPKRKIQNVHEMVSSSGVPRTLTLPATSASAHRLGTEGRR